MKIKQILNDLASDHRKLLMQSFDEEETRILMLDEQTFIAVHYQPQPCHEVIETAGYFTYGKMKC